MIKLPINFTILFAIFVSFYSSFVSAETNIQSIKVIENHRDSILITVSFIYSGDHGDKISMVAHAINGTMAKGRKPTVKIINKDFSDGIHPSIMTMAINRNSDETYSTSEIQVNLHELASPVPFYSKSIPFFKIWKMVNNESSDQDYHEILLSEAISLIDGYGKFGNEGIEGAKKIIEKILLEDPKNAQAYLEMARIQMKENASSDRTHRYTQANRLINIALEIDKNYANSYILLGFVKAREGKVSEAVKALKKAKSLGTRNMWLYYNWGLALDYANDIDGAISIYQEAINQPIKEYLDDPLLKSHNRAITPIYEKLIARLINKNDLKEANEVYKKQIKVLKEPCQFAEYAGFMLRQYNGDYDKSIELAKKSLKEGCGGDARKILAQALLTKIAKSKGLNADEKTKLYYSSQTLVTNNVELIMGLSGSKYTIPAIKVLMEKGINIDEMDSKKMSPLAYAIYYGDLTAVKALLENGANVNQLIGENELSSLMLAIAYKRDNIMPLLLEKGVDINLKSKQGYTALSIAQKIGNKKIQRLLSNKNGI